MDELEEACYAQYEADHSETAAIETDANPFADPLSIHVYYVRFHEKLRKF